jgi:hypothetical protein
MVSMLHLLLPLLAQSASAEVDEGAPGAALVIASESDCPTTQAVRQALANLRPPDDWPAATVTIRATEAMLSIEVGTRGPIQRQLAVGPDCATRASSAALVIATWMDDLPAQATGSPILRAAVAEPAGAPAVPVSPTRYEIGAGLSVAGAGGWAPGLHGEVIRLRAGRSLGWQASLDVVGPHAVSVGDGVTRWMRTSVGLGLHGRLSSETLFLATDLGLAGANTAAWGAGYTGSSSDSSFNWGPVVGARAGLLWGHFRLWTDLRIRWWAKTDNVQIDSPSPAWVAGAELPSWEWQWSLGLGHLLSGL